MLIVVMAFFGLHTTTAQDFSLTSPDQNIVLTISVGENINIALQVDDMQVILPSTIAMTLLDFNKLGKNANVINTEKVSVDQVIYPNLKIKSNQIRDHFNELILSFDNNFRLAFRAYNNGVAYRFETDYDKEIIVQSEDATFNFPEETKVYFPREKEFFSHNECLYEYNALDTLSNKDLCSLPVLLEINSNTKLLITETGLLDYSGMWMTGADGNSMKATFPPYSLKVMEDTSRWPDDRSIRVSENADYIAKTKGKRVFPWRIICVSRTDGDLITNQLPYQLAAPTKLANVAWIKPGKVAWDWWNFNNVYGVDFKAGVNTDTYKYYIDFAAAYGIEYIILDEGWYELGDVLDVFPDVDIKELVNYGKSKNVGLILWVTWSSLDQKLQNALDTFSEWGIRGIKVDFMQRDDQRMVNYYERIASECAKRELLVDFHGSYKPAGLHRTYPNVLTREGVKGAENNKWAKYITSEHNLTIPFIRMVAGPMDYTPGAMVNAQPENFAISWTRPMSIGTRCHQIAMYTVYESPLQMLCDSPSNYLKEDETTKFITQFPTVWDETIVLYAKIGEYIAVARKNGNNWYIGAMNNEEARTLSINFSFLDDANYNIEIFQDGINADRYASDYKRVLKQVSKNDILKINLAKNGGWSGIISKIK